MSFTDKSLMQTYLDQRPRLHALASRVVGCRWKGEDIVQDAWLRLNVETASDVKRPFQYLWTMIFRLAIDARRTAAREPVNIGKFLIPEDTQVAPFVSRKLPLEREFINPLTPEREIAARQELEWVQEILGHLPPRTRSAFELNQIHGLTQREVAYVLGVSPPRVSMMIKQAARHLNDAFTDEN